MFIYICILFLGLLHANTIFDEATISELRKSKCPSSLIPSQQMSDYKFCAGLGAGTFGDVFLVNYTRHNCIYAMKLYKKPRSDDYSREVFFGKKLNSSMFIQPLQELNMTGNEKYFHGLIYEWIPYSMYSFFKLPAVEAQMHRIAPVIVLKLCEGLAELHEKNICHFDIKPGNILIDADISPDGKLNNLNIKYIDLGMTAFLTFTDHGLLLRRQGKIGTRVYMPPELHLPVPIANYTCSVDIWALGQTMLAVVNGGPLFAPLVKSKKQHLIPFMLFRIFSPPNPDYDDTSLTNTRSDDDEDAFGFSIRPPSNYSWPEIEQEPWYPALLKNYTSFYQKLSFPLYPKPDKARIRSIVEKSRVLAESIRKKLGVDLFLLIKGFLRLHPGSRMPLREAIARLKNITEESRADGLFLV